MLRTILFLVTLVGSGIAAESSKNTARETNLSITFETDNHCLTLKPVDLCHLSQTDLETYIDHFSSWTNLESQFGTGLAVILKPLSWILPTTTINDLMTQAMDEMLTKAPTTVQPQYSWFILDGRQKNKFIGTIGLTFYPYDIPKKNAKRHYYNLGMSLIPEYQRKGIATEFAPLFVNHLKNQTTLTIDRALIRTKVDHDSVNHIMGKFNFVKKLGSKEEEVNFVLFKSIIPMNFYEIDLTPYGSPLDLTEIS